MKTFIALLVLCAILMAGLMVEEANGYCCKIDGMPIGHPPTCNVFGCNCECTECVNADDKVNCAAEKAADTVNNLGKRTRRAVQSGAASEVFKSADQNGDGAISKEEALHYFQTKWNKSENDLNGGNPSKNWFAEMDLNGDGKLQPNEVDKALAL